MQRLAREYLQANTAIELEPKLEPARRDADGAGIQNPIPRESVFGEGGEDRFGTTATNLLAEHARG